MARTKKPKIDPKQPEAGAGEPKKRGRPPSPPPPSNVSLATRAEFYQKALRARGSLEDAQEDVRTMNGRYRAVLKDAKKAGVDPDSIIWALNHRNMEPDEIDREIQQINWMLRAAKIPVGGQLGFIDEMTTVASAVDEDALAAQGHKKGVADDDILGVKAYQTGREASLANANRDQNPYNETAYPNAHKRWGQGWDDDTAERVRAMGAERVENEAEGAAA